MLYDWADEDVGESRVGRRMRLLAYTPGRITASSMTRLSIGPTRVALGGVGLGNRRVQHLVDLGDPDARVGRATGLPDDPAVHDLRQEAEAVVPVRAPAVGGQADLVCHDVRRVAGVLREVVTLRVGFSVSLMPTRASDCCSDSAVAFSLGRSARYAMFVSKPLGWPQAVNASLAFATSPVLSGPAGYRSNFW